MGAGKRRAADRAGRPAMRSPGRPPVGRREHRQRFWVAVARGSSSEDAGVAAGVSRPWDHAGSVKAVACQQSAALRCRARPVVRRARGARHPARPRRRGPRPPGGGGGRRRRSPGSCAATPRPVAGGWRIGPRPPSGTLTGVPSAPRSPSSPRASGSGARCSSGWRARPRGPTAHPCRGRRCGGSVGGMGAAPTAGGRPRGVRSRSRTGCRSTSPMMVHADLPRGYLPGPVGPGPRHPGP
jgi:hypothetical protein